MKKNFKSTCAKVTAVALTLAMVVGVVPANAAAKKPALSATKATIKVGATKKVTVKKVTAKKVVWSVNKAGKKVVKLSKATKKGVTIKGLKAGKATVTAKITVGKKNYTKTVKVTVTKKTTPATDAPATEVPATEVPATEVPATEVPAPEAKTLSVALTEDNEADATKGKESYRTNISYNEDGSVSFINTNNYNGGAFFKLAADGSAVDCNDYKYVKAVVKVTGDDSECEEVFVKAKTASTGYWDGSDAFQKYEGADNVKSGKRVIYFNIEDEILDEVAMIGVQTKNTSDLKGIIVYSITLTDTIEEETVEDDDAVVPAIKKVTVSADNEAAATKDKDSYRTNFVDSGAGYVSFVNSGNYNGGAFFNINAEGTPEDLSDYKYVRAVIKVAGDVPADDEVFTKAKTDSSGYWNGSEAFQGYNGADNVTAKKRIVYFNVEDSDLSEIAMVGVMTKNLETMRSIVVYDIAFTNTKGSEYILDDDVVVPTV